MRCFGCDDSVIVINSHVPLCQRCADNTHAGGEFGDLEHEREIMPRVDFEMAVTQGPGYAPLTLAKIVDEATWLDDGVAIEVDGLPKDLSELERPLSFKNTA